MQFLPPLKGSDMLSKNKTFISVSLELEDTEIQLSIFHILLLPSILSKYQGSNCYKQNWCFNDIYINYQSITMLIFTGSLRV